MALPGKFPALPKGTDRTGDRSTNTEIQQAADLVANFAGHNALPVLEALITAAEDEVTLPAARSVRGTASELTRRTESLFAEVARFLTLAPDGKR